MITREIRKDLMLETAEIDAENDDRGTPSKRTEEDALVTESTYLHYLVMRDGTQQFMHMTQEEAHNRMKSNRDRAEKLYK